MASLKLFAANYLADTGEYQQLEKSYGDKPELVLDIYSSKDNITNKPVVIFYYGGCWGACTDLSKQHYRFVAESLVSLGAVVVVPDYRRYPDVMFAEIIKDAALSVQWVGDHIGSYGGDADNIFLMGHSSGAHLAAMLTLNQNYLGKRDYSRLQGLIGLAGPYDFLPLTKAYQQALFAPEQSYAQSQPINFVDGDEPPLLLLYGMADKTVKFKNHKNLSAKVQQMGGDVQIHIYKELDHKGLLAALSIPLRNQAAVRKDIGAFLYR
ncbi:hypothetical protein BST96_11910 [Oceanicoccus sagamiensis]|uniref:BD-FAE-like domain-containing protein n=1 Tax=Oceanicoccus sagamiensis TaxID=716816 RepID=A0A1X9NEC5_9GAMM|nr:hypothetical protein BST96_11910 [Oceanicoccus sagamiensis]